MLWLLLVAITPCTGATFSCLAVERRINLAVNTDLVWMPLTNHGVGVAGDARWVSFYRDGGLWHADGPEQTPANAADGTVGRVDLAAVFACQMTAGRSDQLCLSQAGKCHLLRRDSKSTSSMSEWLKAMQEHVQEGLAVQTAVT